ncbi:hypothetical protein BTGOE5_13550 [Bacillus thuringiensis]|nr:hypothetical protein IIS_01332 [Bacillus cereus VD131]OFD03342.1 hypothetical protein BTGOE5_13550 [Bacillus thuringiensis]OFD09110.1 hypothetical protein BTGOE7_13880 [Bacillus thuringiensis]OSM13900.1 hypothetical protein BTH38_00385 [Bacillus toyonensis]
MKILKYILLRLFGLHYSEYGGLYSFIECFLISTSIINFKENFLDQVAYHTRQGYIPQNFERRTLYEYNFNFSFL